MFQSMQNKIKRIVMVGGGTGGHIYPLISVANELKSQVKCELLFLGSGTAVEKDVLEFESIKFKRIYSGKFRRNFSFSSFIRNFSDLFRILAGFFQSFFVLSAFKPDIIFSKGGFVSVPVCYAARLLRIPLLIHESDVMPSLTTKACSSWAQAVFTAFPIGVYPLWLRKKAIYTGLPIRDDFQKIKKLSEEYILIIGGSSGALRLNDLMFEALPKILRNHKVVHLVGNSEEGAFGFKQNLEKRLQENYEFYKYRADIANLLKDAKLVISRAGATSIFEISALNKRTILIPISETVAPHQRLNAELISSLHLGEVVYEEEGSTKLLKTIDAILKKKESPLISSLYFPGSEKYIAKLITDFIGYTSLSRIKNIFMIGIGGVSMKGLAQILTKMGKNVKGSDLKTGGHSSKNINMSYDLVIYSSAASSHSPARVEHKMAKKLKIPIIKRSRMIGQLMEGHRGISVSGMHGKTTTSSLISQILVRGGLDPSFLIGSEYKQDSPSYNWGNGIDFVSEACEYDGSFLDFPTKIAVVTSIEEEHLDYFKGGLADIISAFSEFISNIHPGGLLVYCQDDPNVSRLVSKMRRELILKKIKLISYGFSDGSNAKIGAYKVEDGICKFKIDNREFSSRKMGRYFALNCAASYAVARFLGVSEDIVLRSVAEFSGASRRFEFLGERNGVLVYDDYGHHPTEIRVTLEALKEAYPNRRKFIIFQPHQQKRFNDFYKDFKMVFKEADVQAIALLPVFSVAGRDEDAMKSTEDLVKELKNHKKYYYLENYENALNFLSQNVKKGDVIMTMGATDIYKVAEQFLKD